jgi:hypothetical protein
MKTFGLAYQVSFIVALGSYGEGAKLRRLLEDCGIQIVDVWKSYTRGYSNEGRYAAWEAIAARRSFAFETSQHSGLFRVYCSNEQFVKFLIERNARGLTNGWKNIKAQSIEWNPYQDSIQQAILKLSVPALQRPPSPLRRYDTNPSGEMKEVLSAVGDMIKETACQHQPSAPKGFKLLLEGPNGEQHRFHF